MERSKLGPGAEFALIERFLHPAQHSERDEVLIGPGDDCAVLRHSGIVLSVDLSVEGVHFRRDWLTPEQIGYRAASAAFSDLAAMAARPLGVLVALAVVEGDADEVVVEVMRGVSNAANGVGAALLGGDLSRSTGPMVIDAAVVGQTDSPVSRSGAEVGDEVWVTGSLGGSGAALSRLFKGESPDPDAFTRFYRPAPRIYEALWLAERFIPKAMLDLSDGLAGDAAHLAAASGVALVLEPDRIPVHPAVEAASRTAAVEFAASAGEDYELCLCAAPGAAAGAADHFLKTFGLTLTRVGVVERGEGVFWRAPDGGRAPARRGGFQHFGGSA